MSSSRTTLETGQARRYMTLVCKHWSHRFAVSFEPDKAVVEFGDSSCHFTVHAGALEVLVVGENAALPQLESIVIDHLQRFAPRGTLLQATWQRSA